MMKLAIRVDASSDIGIGHLFRCLRLADNTYENFEKITFISHNPSNFYREKIKEHGFELKTISMHDDLKFLDSNYDFLIKDHYNLDINWENHARTKTLKLIVIDDHSDKKHSCDIYINQNPVKVNPSNFPCDCLILDGLRYAMLPNSLLQYKNAPKGNDIIISLGGSDPTNDLKKCLDAFQDMNDYHFHFIAGKENLNAPHIESICNSTAHYTYHHFINNIHEQAATALACITAGGTLLRELIYMQVPCFLITNHKVQIPIAKYFKSQNSVFYAGHHSEVTVDGLKTSFANFINNKDQLETYQKNMTSLIDGKGLSRIANAISSPGITLIAATSEHCQTIYDWRNHPKTRQYSGNIGEINLENHNKWFAAKLQDTESYLFIAQADGKDIGVLRFDPTEKDLIVSLYLSPDHYGHGYGASILLTGVETLKENGLTPVSLLAKILPDNYASQNAFKKAGFVKITDNDWKKDIL